MLYLLQNLPITYRKSRTCEESTLATNLRIDWDTIGSSADKEKTINYGVKIVAYSKNHKCNSGHAIT